MKTTITKTLLSMILLFTVLACSNNDDDTSPIIPDYTTVEDFLNEVGFQGSAFIRKGNTTVLSKGFGMADVDNNIENDPSLVYRIGSMTKAFTAMGLVNLKRDGLIESYDQTLSDFDDEFPRGDEITLRQMFTHYSGLPDYIGPIEAAVDEQNMFFTPEDIYDIIKESAGEDGLLFDPGSNFAYSNSNYLIIGLLIEELTGMAYDEYIREKVTGPLAMSQTKVGADDIQGTGYAKGYEDGLVVDPYQMDLAYSAGEFESTIDDLETWADALMGNSFLSAEEKAEYFAPSYSEDDYFVPGMGWFTIKIDGTLVYNHGGNIDGFSSMMALLPETNSVIILLSNVENWSPMNEVLETLVKNEF